MKTECNTNRVNFSPLKNKKVIAAFDGEEITSDAGLLLIKEVDKKFRVTEQLAECFVDFRHQNRCRHSVSQLLKQRIYGICSGYEDLNDHDALRKDPLFSLLTDKNIEKNAASKSTLNRLELTPENVNLAQSDRYHKILFNPQDVEQCFVQLFLQTTPTPSTPIILDFDATDDPLHGNQEGRFFHGYYGHYCYLPLYVFCGDFLLCAKLRPSDIDAASGALNVLQHIVTQVRAKWKDVSIIVRGDSGFCREDIKSWCETNDVDYIFGLARNNRLEKEVEEEAKQAKTLFEQIGEPVRFFKEFSYRTLKTWSCSRRVIAKVEHLRKGANPRFIVTSLSGDPQELYEKMYCARGDMENRIKEQQLDLFADRTSCFKMKDNQLRLWMSSFAYCLIHLLRTYGLQERLYSGTVRIKLLKIGACIRSSCRRIYISLSESYAFKALFLSTYYRLARASPG